MKIYNQFAILFFLAACQSRELNDGAKPAFVDADAECKARIKEFNTKIATATSQLNEAKTASGQVSNTLSNVATVFTKITDGFPSMRADVGNVSWYLSYANGAATSLSEASTATSAVDKNTASLGYSLDRELLKRAQYWCDKAGTKNVTLEFKQKFYSCPGYAAEAKTQNSNVTSAVHSTSTQFNYVVSALYSASSKYDDTDRAYYLNQASNELSKTKPMRTSAAEQQTTLGPMLGKISANCLTKLK